ncbi:MAG: type IV secretion system DNA-binding domain-containing protein [Patescibacteria group bacterium]
MPIPYNHDHENEISLFAAVNFRNQFRRFGIKTDDRRRHMYVLGKTGVGKTTLLENLFLSDVLAGHGCCYIDPHGDTAEKLLDFIPPNRINDVVYFNPADLDFPVGFNILETAREDQKHLVASGLMGVFKKIWPDVWSPRMEYILLNCVLALLDYPGATLLGINRLLVDKEYRAKVVAKLRNPIVKTFWLAEFTSWSEKYATEAIAPVQNKVGQFLSASIIRNIVAQVKSSINPREIMDEGKIFIVNLSKGKIGEDNMRLLGGMLVTKIQLAAMERVDIKNEDDRRDFYLFVDEFQNFANQSFASILSEARKYRLNLTVTHQYIKQLAEEEVADAIFGNVGTIACMRVGGEDVAFLETEFAPTFTPEDLVNLPKYQMYLKLMVDGVSTAPFSATTLPPISNRTGSEPKVIAVCRERYAEPRASMEEKILRWSGMEASSMPIGLSYPEILTADEKAVAEEKGDLKPAVTIEDVAQKAEDETEYLRISPERLSAISKPPQQAKKEKPKFSHTCTRCGKTWDMPIKLDPSKPMYCAECLPLMKEERKVKKAVMKAAVTGPIDGDESVVVQDAGPANESATAKLGSLVDGKLHTQPKPNRPRFVGERKPLPKGGFPGGIKIVTTEEPEPALSLMDELKKAKGKDIETDKGKLSSDRPRAGVAATSADDDTTGMAPRSSTVFKKTVSSVRSTLKPLEPGQNVRFD